jgi:hypothetical protein
MHIHVYVDTWASMHFGWKEIENFGDLDRLKAGKRIFT